MTDRELMQQEQVAEKFEKMHANGNIWITTIAAAVLVRNTPAPPQRKPLTEDMVHRAMIALNTSSCGELQPTYEEMKAAIEAAHGIGEKT